MPRAPPRWRSWALHTTQELTWSVTHAHTRDKMGLSAALGALPIGAQHKQRLGCASTPSRCHQRPRPCRAVWGATHHPPLGQGRCVMLGRRDTSLHTAVHHSHPHAGLRQHKAKAKAGSTRGAHGAHQQHVCWIQQCCNTGAGMKQVLWILQGHGGHRWGFTNLGLKGTSPHRLPSAVHGCTPPSHHQRRPPVTRNCGTPIHTKRKRGNPLRTGWHGDSMAHKQRGHNCPHPQQPTQGCHTPPHPGVPHGPVVHTRGYPLSPPAVPADQGARPSPVASPALLNAVTARHTPSHSSNE
jgi:hypothetical protein